MGGQYTTVTRGTDMFMSDGIVMTMALFMLTYGPHEQRYLMKRGFQFLIMIFLLAHQKVGQTGPRQENLLMI